MLPALDRLIRDGRGAVERRPQQLFLTGDQIYADDVATAVCHLATTIGADLLGAVEHVPTSWRGDPARARPRAGGPAALPGRPAQGRSSWTTPG